MNQRDLKNISSRIILRWKINRISFIFWSIFLPRHLFIIFVHILYNHYFFLYRSIISNNFLLIWYFCHFDKYYNYRWTSLSAVFLSANLLIHNWNIGLKGQISSQNVSFYLRIQYLRSKIAGRIYRE